MLKSGGSTNVVKESEFKEEIKMHKLLKENPELIPASDFGMEPLMVVGRETPLTSGFPDLIAVDRNGGIAIVECKLEKNQTIREVISQLLDYGSYLWKLTYEDFEDKVVLDYFRSKYVTKEYRNMRTLIEAVRYFVNKNNNEIDFDEESFKRNILKNLAEGTFTYIIGSTEIDDRNKRMMEYLNSIFNMRVYGVEIDYYGNEEKKIEIYVPRSIVFKPPTIRRKIDEEEFLRSCDRLGEIFFKKIFKHLEELDGDIQFGTSGFSYRLPFENKELTIFQGYPKETRHGRLYIIFYLLQNGGVKQEFIDEFRDKLEKSKLIKYKTSKKHGLLDITEKIGDRELVEFIDIVRWLIEKLKKHSD